MSSTRKNVAALLVRAVALDLRSLALFRVAIALVALVDVGRRAVDLVAHYTDEGEIKIIVEPVLMAPLRREWAALKATLLASLKRE